MEDEIKDEMIRHRNEMKGSWHLKKETDDTNNTTVELINILKLEEEQFTNQNKVDDMENSLQNTARKAEGRDKQMKAGREDDR